LVFQGSSGAEAAVPAGSGEARDIIRRTRTIWEGLIIIESTGPAGAVKDQVKASLRTSNTDPCRGEGGFVDIAGHRLTFVDLGGRFVDSGRRRKFCLQQIEQFSRKAKARNASRPCAGKVPRSLVRILLKLLSSPTCRAPMVSNSIRAGATAANSIDGICFSRIQI